MQNLSLFIVPAALAIAAGAAQPRISAPSSATIAPAASHQGAALSSSGQQAQARAIRYVVATTGNEARYRVREQLVGFDLPNDAVGRTSQVTGAITVGADGKINREGSSFTVDLASIRSDNDRRDGYVRRNTLQTDSFPKAVFVPTAFEGLPATLPTAGDASFRLTGDLTIHGVTKPTTWQVKARRNASGTVSGAATTTFKFGEFNMTLPRAARVLSVDDSITLEFDFTLEPQPATP